MPSKCDRPCADCRTLVRRTSYRCRTCEQQRRRGPAPTVSEDRARSRERLAQAALRRNYDEALKTIERYERASEAMKALATNQHPVRVEAHSGSGTNEGTVVIVASDWHIEEMVGSEVGGLNVYNAEIAQERAQTFFAAGLRLTKLLQQDITIRTVVLALLGDFISGDIHEEFSDITDLTPMHAIVRVQQLLIGGIEHFLSASPKLHLIVPCHSGNHARTTTTTRFSSENGHSLEYLLYLHLAAYFRHEPRVVFQIAEGYHSYLEVYNTMLRFHHGHGIRYGGGVGGIYIPVNKAIAQWNKAKHADLDVFGHFHQLRDGGNFICNGSQIGYNGFALSIKADYESPKQALFLVDKKRGRTCTWPIVYAR